MAGDLNAKHVDWNSRLSTRQGKLLRDYADGNSCLIFGPENPTTNPHNPLATSDVLYIVITKNHTSPVYLTSCSALSSDYLPVLIDTTCRSSSTNRIALISGALTGTNSKLTWNIKFRSIRNYTNGWQLTRSLRTSPAPSSRFWRHLLPNVAACRPTASDTGWHLGRNSLKNRLRRQWQVTRDPTLRAEVYRMQRSVTRRLNEWRNDQWSATLESLNPEDQSLWRMAKRVMRVPTPSSPWSPRGIALSDSEKAEALADTLETQFQPVADASVPAVIEMVDVELRSYFQTQVKQP